MPYLFKGLFLFISNFPSGAQELSLKGLGTTLGKISSGETDLKVHSVVKGSSTVGLLGYDLDRW